MRRYVCRDCKFWNETGALPPAEGSITVVNVGECRHSPPIGNPRSWPGTYETDWCGRIEVNLSANLPPPPPPPPPPQKPRARDYPLPPDGMPRRMALAITDVEVEEAAKEAEKPRED
jgi:hypothetical protein